MEWHRIEKHKYIEIKLTKLLGPKWCSLSIITPFKQTYPQNDTHRWPDNYFHVLMLVRSEMKVEGEMEWDSPLLELPLQRGSLCSAGLPWGISVGSKLTACVSYQCGCLAEKITYLDTYVIFLACFKYEKIYKLYCTCSGIWVASSFLGKVEGCILFLSFSISLMQIIIIISTDTLCCSLFCYGSMCFCCM